MYFLRLVPMLETENLKETITFYEKNLGYICMSYDEELGWASLSKDGTTIMIALPNAHISFEKPTFTGSLYFYTNQVDQLWNHLKDKTEVCYEIEDFSYGMREFAIYDNNGYMLQFGQTIKTPVSP